MHDFQETAIVTEPIAREILLDDLAGDAWVFSSFTVTYSLDRVRVSTKEKASRSESICKRE